MGTTTETRSTLDTLRDALEWVTDGVRCIHLDPDEIAAELRGMIEKMEKVAPHE